VKIKLKVESDDIAKAYYITCKPFV